MIWQSVTISTRQAQQRLFFLRTLWCSKMPKQLFVNFYCCTIKSTLTSCCTVWCSSYTAAADRKNLQRVIKSAQWIIKSAPPRLEKIHSTCLQRHARDPVHPGQASFSALPSGRQRTARTIRQNSPPLAPLRCCRNLKLPDMHPFCDWMDALS